MHDFLSLLLLTPLLAFHNWTTTMVHSWVYCLGVVHVVFPEINI